MARTRTRCSSACRCRAPRTPRKPRLRRSTPKSGASSKRAIRKRTRILTEKRADLESLAKGLLEFETLSGDEITDLLNGKKPNRESVLEPTTPRTSAVPPAGKPRPRPDPDAGLEPQPQA